MHAQRARIPGAIQGRLSELAAIAHPLLAMSLRGSTFGKAHIAHTILYYIIIGIIIIIIIMTIIIIVMISSSSSSNNDDNNNVDSSSVCIYIYI